MQMTATRKAEWELRNDDPPIFSNGLTAIRSARTRGQSEKGRVVTSTAIDVCDQPS